MNKRGFGKLYQKNFDEKISVNEAIKEIECFSRDNIRGCN